MDPVNYYITTLTAAFKNIAPIAVFLIGGYFIFFKLPFLFLRKNMAEQKKKMEEDAPQIQKEERYTVEHYQEFQKTLKLMNGGQKEEPKQQQKKTENTRQEKKQEHKQEQKREQKQERTQRPSRPESPAARSPEEIFNLRPGEKLSSGELKKRYFELLKQNHPDRVASMGAEFKKLAEKNTKEINTAFEALKKKAG